jgi:hypothetical protein
MMDNSEVIKKKVDEALAKKLLAVDRAIMDIRAKIVAGASSGLGFEGEALPGYSKSYADKRGKAGYSERVNLIITGQMLRDVQVEPLKKEGADYVARIFIANGTSAPPKKMGGGPAVGSVEKAQKTMEKRPWFGISQQNKELLRTVARNS